MSEERKQKLGAEFKAQWLKALRSGDYEQAKHGLCARSAQGASYCCLGVAHEVQHGEEAWKDRYPDDDEAWLYDVEGDSALYVPPGLTGDDADTLAGMNDNGSTFLEIADYIEEHF